MCRNARIVALVVMICVIPAWVADAAQLYCGGYLCCKYQRIKSVLARMNELPPLFSFCPGTEKSIWDRIRFNNDCEIRCESCGPDAKKWFCHQRYIRHCDVAGQNEQPNEEHTALLILTPKN